MIIAPSLLAANFARLEHEVARATRSGAEWLHLDIMDGHFVPNISFGPHVVSALRPLSRMFFDVHLMCSKPEILIEPFARAGANQLTIHVELGSSVEPLLWKIRAAGIRAGLAVNPGTQVQAAAPFLKQIELLLIMTVHPGFGGQAFISETVPKIQQADRWRREKGFGYRIGVDGGIDFRTARECAETGADTFVAGTSLFGRRNLKAAVEQMRRVVTSAAARSAALPTRIAAPA